MFVQHSIIKPLLAKQIIDLYFLKDDKEKIMNGFRAVGLNETVNDAQNVRKIVENPFRKG